MATGCCNPSSSSAVRYACGECHQSTNGCCKIYEHCISCCMDPKKVLTIIVTNQDPSVSLSPALQKPVLMNVLNEASALKNILRTYVHLQLFFIYSSLQFIYSSLRDGPLRAVPGQVPHQGPHQSSCVCVAGFRGRALTMSTLYYVAVWATKSRVKKLRAKRVGRRLQSKHTD